MENQEALAEDDYLGTIERHYKKPYDQWLKEEAISKEDEEEQLELLRFSMRYRKIINKKRREQNQINKSKIADQKEQKSKRQIVEKDDSETSLQLLRQWKKDTPRNPPRYIINDVNVTDQYSEPIYKQLMNSDVKEDQCRLMLGKEQVKKMMSEVLEKSERVRANGIEVSVYGPCGKVFEMMFKMWNGDTPVLTSKGWNEYVKEYRLVEFEYFLTIWMFRHRETRKICFAIDSSHLSIRTMLSRQSWKTAFEEDDN